MKYSRYVVSIPKKEHTFLFNTKNNLAVKIEKLIVKLGSNFIIFFIQENFYQKEMSWKKQYKCLGTEMYQLLESLYLLMEIVILDVSIVMKNL